MAALVAYDSSSCDEEQPAKPAPLKKRPKGPVKISIPKLNKNDSDSDDEPAPKRPKPQGGGLTALLPPPKSVRPSSKPMVPHTVSRSKVTRNVSKGTRRPPAKPAKNKMADSDSDDETPTSFFSLDQPSKPSVPEPPAPIPEQQFPIPEQQVPVQEEVSAVGPSLPTGDYQYAGYGNNEQYRLCGDNEQYLHPQSQPAASEFNIPEEELRRLAGGRGRFEPGLSNMTEIREDDVKDTIKTFMKHNSEDSVNKFFQKEAARMVEPTGQQKRKHQLSYLAHQAKTNEIELSKHWAASAASKRQTKMKYGF